LKKLVLAAALIPSLALGNSAVVKDKYDNFLERNKQIVLPVLNDAQKTSRCMISNLYLANYLGEEYADSMVKVVKITMELSDRVGTLVEANKIAQYIEPQMMNKPMGYITEVMRVNGCKSLNELIVSELLNN
jgi:gamma-glutamyl phosphate reductase